jgi:hypothetical protein
MKPNGNTLDSRFALWLVLLVLGFAYVSVVLCGRTNPFVSRYDRTTDLAIVLLLAPGFYLAGPRRNFPRLDANARRVVWQFGLGYLVPFAVALHFDYLGKVLGVQFSLTASDLHGLDLAGKLAFLGGALLVTGLLGYHFVLARKEGILLPYGAAFVAIPLGVAIVTYLLRETHYLHVHHYLYGAYLVPFFRFDRALSRGAQATFLGICIEGASRWGLDPIWYRRT